MEIAKSIPTEVLFDELTETIVSNFSNSDSIAKCAYIWIAQNIEYDYESLASESNDPDSFWVRNSYEQVLSTRKAVCAGYSGLFQAILTECDVEAVTISGTSRQGRDFVGTYSLSEDHAWNAYKSSDSWNLVDVTWASNIKENGQISDFYFRADPRVFVVSHFPSDPQWQLLDKPITYSEFVNSVYVNYRFFETELGNLPPSLNWHENQIQLSFDFHEYWKPRVYILVDTTYKMVQQTLQTDTINQKTLLTFPAKIDDIVKIEANWIIWGNTVAMNYPEVGFLKITEKEIIE